MYTYEYAKICINNDNISDQEKLYNILKQCLEN